MITVHKLTDKLTSWDCSIISILIYKFPSDTFLDVFYNNSICNLIYFVFIGNGCNVVEVVGLRKLYINVIIGKANPTLKTVLNFII